jgi:hypothetical protein
VRESRTTNDLTAARVTATDAPAIDAARDALLDARQVAAQQQISKFSPEALLLR